MPSEADLLLSSEKSSPESSSSECTRRRSHRDNDAGLNGRPFNRKERPPPTSSGNFLINLVLFIFTIPWIIVIYRAVSKTQPENQTVRQRVDRILENTPLIDGHNDLAILIRYLHHNRIYNTSFTDPFENGGMPAHFDLPRMRSGKMGGAFWSAYVDCPKNWEDFSDNTYTEAVQQTLEQIDLLSRLRDVYPSVFSDPHLNGTTALQAFKEKHQLISPLAIEGLHQIGNSMSNLRAFFSLGVRYATLTHNCHNIFADAAMVTNSSGDLIAASPYWGGVSERGRLLIREMNRLGMLVDLSHVSKDTMLDVLGGRPDKWNGSAAPVMFSHSSAFHICPHPRNVADDVLELVRKTKSVVMINVNPGFISCVPSKSSTGLPDVFLPNSTIQHVVRHIKYIGDLIGYEYVGIGSDFDGITDTPRGLEDVSKFPDLIAEMLEQGISDRDAARVVGGNILRVWRAVDRISGELQQKGIKPLEDEIKPLEDDYYM